MKTHISVPRFLTTLMAGGLCFANPLPAQDKDPEPKISRTYIVPADFLMRGSSPEAAPGGAPPADPFADPAPSPKPASEPAERCPKFPRVIPALGERLPTDVRRVFEDLGVTFAEGDFALLHPRRTRAVLFVRIGREQHDIVETILAPGFEDFIVKTVRYTWLLTERCPQGKTRTLIERSLLCCSGQRAKFERHRAGRLLESLECETTVSEDGVTVDFNNAVELHLKGLDVKVTNQALLRSEDPAGAVLYTGRGMRPGSTAELRVTADVIRGIPSPDWKSGHTPHYLASLTKEIEQQLQDLEKTGAPEKEKEKRPELFYMVPWFGNEGEGKTVWRETGLVQFKAQHMMDARGFLRKAGVELEKEDAAWYAPESRLLYINAAAAGRSRAAEMTAHMQMNPLFQAEVQLASGAERKEKVREFPLRSLLVKGQQQSTAESTTKDGITETIEIEFPGKEAGEAADLRITLTNFSMGNETWTLNTKTYAAIDGTHPVSLVSGRAADAGGAFKSVTLTAKPAGDQWAQMLADPVRKAAALREFEAALAPPATGK